ncbi:MAG: methionyl-tRNA formyltransferase, partial [Alphaproteobacteria bacterium]
TARYLVATVKPWNLAAFARHVPNLPGKWHLITAPEELTPELIDALRPRYVFFPHWSWKVPDAVLAATECVCFHMTDLPYGRGGSPLQNLIARGHTETKVSALRMVAEMDAGPIYLKRPLALDGSAQAIFERLADLVYGMAAEIAADAPKPVPQSGPVTVFARRKPEQSRLPAAGGIDALYDHIRMLDADTYPRAFTTHGGFRLEFTDARIEDGALRAHVAITPDED